jgi:hypothetical protein
MTTSNKVRHEQSFRELNSCLGATPSTGKANVALTKPNPAAVSLASLPPQPSSQFTSTARGYTRQSRRA